MLQKINNLVNTSYVIVLSRSTAELISALVERKSGSKWYSSLIPGQIDFKEITIKGNQIEILRMPRTISPFRACGKITLQLQETEIRGQTKITCEISPNNNTMPYLILYQILTTCILATLFLILGKDLITQAVGAMTVLFVPAFISYFNYRYSKRDLLDYSHVVIKVMRD